MNCNIGLVLVPAPSLLSSSMVEHSAVNRQVIGSSPILGAIWPVGEAVNTHAFHACIHGFKSRTGHQHRVLAQLGERLPYKQVVGGSSPSHSTIMLA